MNGNESLNELRSAIWRQEQDAAKNLVVLNSGATVVGFGFAGQTWNNIPEIQFFIIFAVLLFLAGIVCASTNMIFFVKYYIEWNYRSVEEGLYVLEKRKKYRFIYHGLNIFSLSLFVLGNVCVLVGLLVTKFSETT